MTSTEESSVFQKNFIRGFNPWMTRNLFNTIYKQLLYVVKIWIFNFRSTDTETSTPRWVTHTR